MTRTLARFLLHLNTRERGLLLALVLIVLPLGLIWGLVLPLAEQRRAAHLAVDDQLALRDWVARRVADAPPPISGRSGDTPAPAPLGISGIEASLVAAGLRGDATLITNAPNGGISLRFERVSFTRLMGWLDETEVTAGYSVAALRVQAGDAPDTVQADIQMDPLR